MDIGTGMGPADCCMTLPKGAAHHHVCPERETGAPERGRRERRRRRVGCRAARRFAARAVQACGWLHVDAGGWGRPTSAVARPQLIYSQIHIFLKKYICNNI